MAEEKTAGDSRDSDAEPAEEREPDDEAKEETETTPGEIGISKKIKRKRRKGKKAKKQIVEKESDAKKKADGKGGTTSPRGTAPSSTFALIAKELKTRRLAQMAHMIAMSKKRKKNRVLRDEEVYTDKDRAAAVNMGTSDIKQSLKMKKKQDKNYDLEAADEGDPATILALGNSELRSGHLMIALNFINKALELNPDDKNGLVARSKCYLSLGNPRLALNDAETALLSDKTFVRGIYQKAEALYHLGDFEHSLMYYHRGHRLRPELESFRLGVQKAQEAIENTIGTTTRSKSIKRDKLRTSAEEARKSFNLSGGKKETEGNFGNQSTGLGEKNSSRKFLGELATDKIYLENLLKHPDLMSPNQEVAKLIRAKAEEGITYLKSRQEFWKQQKPSVDSRRKLKRHLN